MMKTKTYHITNLGSYRPYGVAVDAEGYVEYDDDPRYSAASESQLDAWSEDECECVRNAALTELAERRLTKWRGRA